MKLHILTMNIIFASLLSACGGGGGYSSPAPAPVQTAAVITSVTNGPLMYGKTATFTITGTHLDSGVTFTAPACANRAMAAGSTALQQIWTCTPSASGALTVSVGSTGIVSPTTVTPLVPAPRVTMKTSLGDIVLELYPNNAPLTVNNFLQYVNDGYYNDKIYHRVISNFMIQGGGYNAAMVHGSTRAPIALEVGKGLSNDRGTIAMARTSVLDSATSEFFINVVDNPALNTQDGGYAVFGMVVAGMATVDAIKVVPVNNPTQNLPITTVQITSVVQTQ